MKTLIFAVVAVAVAMHATLASAEATPDDVADFFVRVQAGDIEGVQVRSIGLWCDVETGCVFVPRCFPPHRVHKMGGVVEAMADLGPAPYCFVLNRW